MSMGNDTVGEESVQIKKKQDVVLKGIYYQ